MKKKNKLADSIVSQYFSRKFLLLIAILTSFVASAQFPGAAGTPGTTAIHADSSIFVGWANSCIVGRGHQSIADTSFGYASVGADTNGTNKAGYNPVVSLGDGGWAVLSFPVPITNGNGFDFAVFENAFSDNFLELAFVEVSSDGINFYRFPATSNTQTQTQIGPFDYLGDATLLNNLAGKYRAMYGTPFDLQDLQGTPGLDINFITHVKIIDVVGCVYPPFARYDKNNNPINDPYPTVFASGGFDLDAVGIIHELNLSAINETNTTNGITVFPNPANDFITIYSNQTEIIEMILYNVHGEVIKTTKEHSLLINDIEVGVYTLKTIGNRGVQNFQKIIKN